MVSPHKPLPRAHPSFANRFVRQWEGAGTVYFTSIRRAREEPFTTCACYISLRFVPFPVPSPLAWIHLYLLYAGTDMLRAVRFKIISDDGTIILMPKETRAVVDEVQPL